MIINSADRALALASMVQSASLVTSIAKTGMAPVDAVEACVHSLFVTHPTTFQDIFKHGDQVQLGQRRLKQVWTHPEPEDHQVMLIVHSLLRLTTTFTKTDTHMRGIGLGITTLSTQLAEMDHQKQQTDEFIFESFAALYQEWLSSLQPRIMINGSPYHLQNPSNLCKIRTLLLAGVRGTLLWRQLGGRRWQLFFSRKAILNEFKVN